jgi:hypothetical protein
MPMNGEVNGNGQARPYDSDSNKGDGPATLASIIYAWIKDTPKYAAHYRLVSHTIVDTLTWIECTCKPSGNLPPTPNYDILIDDKSFDVWDVRINVDTQVSAMDKDFFKKLAYYLDKSHDA